MNFRLITLTATVLAATSTALAAAPTAAPERTDAASSAERTLHDEIVKSMQEVLLAVVPEISLPSIEIVLAPLDALLSR